MTPRMMDPDVYDTLVLVADEVGGVGAAYFFEKSTNAPLCIHGCAQFAEVASPWVGEIARELLRLGIDGRANNEAVARIVGRRPGGRYFIATHERVDIRELFAELGVVRGPEVVE